MDERIDHQVDIATRPEELPKRISIRITTTTISTITTTTTTTTKIDREQGNNKWNNKN